MSHIELLGLNGEHLEHKHLSALKGCVAVAASRRHQSLVAELHLPVLPLTPLSTLFTALEKALTKGKVAVLASGDPLCFGIGRRLIEHFGPELVRIHPALSALQLACARFRIPWDDLALLSLHGRGSETDGTTIARLLSRERTLVFTDVVNSPNRIAALLSERLQLLQDTQRGKCLRIRVAENLGLADERLLEGSLAEIAGQSFSPLNVMLVEQSNFQPRSLHFGLTESELAHSRGLITKDEVRAASLHALRLPRQGVLWDIGGGSGSISIEAAGLAPNLQIYTVEKEAEHLENIKANIRTYAAYTVCPVAGEAPEALTTLPTPDRVFVGGSGQRMAEILEIASSRLAQGGRILVNTVRPQSEQQALSCLQNLDLRVQSRSIAVTRHSYLNAEARILNPITLITGDK